MRENEDEFIQTAMSNSVQRKSSELTKAKKTLKQAEKRIADLDKLFTRLYEDNVLGRLSDERFTMMSAGYEDEPDKSSGKRVQDIEIHFRFDVAVSTISVETGKYGKKVA